VKVNRFLLSSFPIAAFTFSYLPPTITRLPTYHNRSTCLKSKTVDVESVITMRKINKEIDDTGFEVIEALPKNRYTISMSWEVN
jgi:hypothetical protein